MQLYLHFDRLQNLVMCNASLQYLVYINDILLLSCLIVRFQFHVLSLTAQQQRIDVVLVDTAGRMQNNEPLMRSLAKVNILGDSLISSVVLLRGRVFSD